MPRMRRMIQPRLKMITQRNNANDIIKLINNKIKDNNPGFRWINEGDGWQN